MGTNSFIKRIFCFLFELILYKCNLISCQDIYGWYFKFASHVTIIRYLSDSSGELKFLKLLHDNNKLLFSLDKDLLDLFFFNFRPGSTLATLIVFESLIKLLHQALICSLFKRLLQLLDHKLMGSFLILGQKHEDFFGLHAKTLFQNVI